MMPQTLPISLQHIVIHCNTWTLQHTASHGLCNAQQRTGKTATHCNTLQHTATHCYSTCHDAQGSAVSNAKTNFSKVSSTVTLHRQFSSKLTFGEFVLANFIAKIKFSNINSTVTLQKVTHAHTHIQKVKFSNISSTVILQKVSLQ